MHSTTTHFRVAGVQKLLIGHSKIRAGKYFLAPFRIDEAMEGAHVVGRVRTAAGSNDSVQVAITESDDYYLAFSNLLSASDKDVFGDVELRFLTH